MHLQQLKPCYINHLKKCVITKFLGDGGFGIVEVYECKQLHNNVICNRSFVVKRIKKKYGFCNNVKEKYIDSLYNEYNMGILLDHVNIRKTFDIDTISHSVIFENCPGIDLLDYANLYKLPNTRHLLSYFSQIIEAVRYLHDKSLAHLDIKLENIILNTNTNVIKLVDFGEAVVFKESGKDIEFFNTRGTVEYFAPEMVARGKFFADRVDVWCCGVIFYNLFYNIMPWKIASVSDKRYSLYLSSIMKNELDSRVFSNNCETCNYYSETEIVIIYKLFKMLLHPKPEKRKSISMIKSIFGLIKFDKDE